MIVDLANDQKLLLVGGKGAWLGKLLHANIRVPNGFVITADTQFPLNNTDKQAILAKFSTTFNKNQKVAVRSSSVNEDGSDKSFAGQFDTFLNVARDDLIEKIAKVHASATKQNIKNYSGEAESQIAVIVQHMVNSEISGVAFSANIITKNCDEIMIEAVNGLGEKLVSGIATPDLFVIAKSSREILLHEIGEEKVDLSEKNLHELIDFIIKIEDFAKKPMDIEWALANNAIYILQARPITTLTNKKEENDEN